MSLVKDKEPLVGFRYGVSIVPENQIKGASEGGNAANIIGSAISTSEEASFSEISGFSATLETEDIEAGGDNLLHLPKQIKFSPLVLKRGFTSAASELVRWVSSIIFTESVGKEITTMSVIVKLLNEENDPLVYWVFNGAFPTKWSTSGLKAMTNELVIEEIELKYKFFYPVFLSF
jgi:phage tail-like protein